MPLISALKASNIQGALTLIHSGNVDLEARDEDNRTALMLAIHLGELEVVRLLMSKKVELKIIDKQGHSPLSLALFLSFGSASMPAEMEQLKQKQELVKAILAGDDAEAVIAHLDKTSYKDYIDLAKGYLSLITQKRTIALAKKIEKPLLFLVKKGSLEFFVLGTYHTIPLSDFNADTQAFLKSCHNVVIEEIHETLEDTLKVTDGLSTEDAARFKDYDEDIQDAFLKLDMHAGLKLPAGTTLNCLKPWALLYLYVRAKHSKSMSNAINIEGMDDGLRFNSIYNKGLKFGLETQSDLIRAANMNKLSFESVQTYMRKLLLEQKTDGEEQSQNTRNEKTLECAYRNGDLKGLLSSLNQATRIEKDFINESSTGTRNLAWWPKILGYVRENAKQQKRPLLVAVGAAHLVGENGLEAIAKKAGFSFSLATKAVLKKTEKVQKTRESGKLFLPQFTRKLVIFSAAALAAVVSIAILNKRRDRGF